MTNLSGLTDLATVGELHVVDNDALTSLAGADALSELFHLQVLGNPMISQAAFDGFVATFAEPPVTACFEDCSCFEGN